MPNILDPTAFESLALEIDLDGAIETFNLFVTDTRHRLRSFSTMAVDANRKRIEIEAHSLKSTAATFGFRKLSELAARLEQDAVTIPEQAFRAIVPELDDAFEQGKAQFDAAFKPAA
jgi:HPt (histidine-containing phosphotransfer) domain-containing protein